MFDSAFPPWRVRVCRDPVVTGPVVEERPRTVPAANKEPVGFSNSRNWASRCRLAYIYVYDTLCVVYMKYAFFCM